MPAHALIALIEQCDRLTNRGEWSKGGLGIVAGSRIKLFIKERCQQFPAFILDQESNQQNEQFVTEKLCKVTSEGITSWVRLWRERIQIEDVSKSLVDGLSCFDSISLSN